MKLNPFSKKTATGYYDRIKAEHDQLEHDLSALQTELAEAKEEHAQKREKYERLHNAGGSLSMNTPPAAKAFWPEYNEAAQRVSQLESRVSTLDDRLRPLRSILKAPAAFTEAKHKLAALLAQRKTATADLEIVDAQLAKLQQRVTGLETRIAAETKAASQTLLASEGEFVVPESLSRLESELRIVKASVADQKVERGTLTTVLDGLPEAIRQARHAFVHYRASVEEIALYEQLTPVMNIVARASAAKRESGSRHSESTFEIEIPSEWVKTAGETLAAEMPGYVGEQ
ncbi:MAG: hypothetical protein LBI92_01960 [Azoarcus sp.]|jgi:chromosome segregation ATPase|nr:hypothetical protein [Azoarcus sp.]